MVLFAKIYVYVMLLISFILLARTIFIIDRYYILRCIAIFLLMFFIFEISVNMDRFNTLTKQHRNIYIYISLLIYLFTSKLCTNLKNQVKDD